jgi:hypothetical protein
MFRQGKSSWRFSTDLSNCLHAALFVRDALDLPVMDAGAIPPRLDGDLPELNDRIAADAQVGAAAAWPSWWDNLVRLELRKDRVAGTRDLIPQLRRELAALVDPPGWASLEDHAGLRRAARVAFEDGSRWANEVLEAFKPPQPSRQLFHWEWVRDVAHHVAGDHGVDLGAVRGSAQVLLVGGSWWTLVEPGGVLCSTGAAEDEATAREVLRLVFESTLSP